MADNTEFRVPELKNFEELAGQPGQCFYVPPYQRYVTWQKVNIQRFFEDIVSGINRLTDSGIQNQVVTFLGSMIFYHDTRYSSIEPKVRTEVPPSVYNIIDGQQRLTVLMMTCVFLHDYIRVTSRELDEGLLSDKCKESMSTLLRTIRHNTESGEKPFYPRIIRAYVDQWSKRESESRYTSPLALFVSKYVEYIDGEPENRHYRYNLESISTNNMTDEERENHEIFHTRMKEIQNHVKKLCANSSRLGEDGMNLPRISNIIDNRHAMFALFNLEELDESTLTILQEDNTEGARYAKILRSLVLTSYVLKRILFISLVTVEENDAFDIFESLNTTGVSLTAIETFKPEVVRFEGIANFSNSESEEHFSSIDSYIGTIKEEKGRARTSSDIVINFAIAEDGIKLSRHLSEQRTYLCRNYKNCNGNEEASGKRRLTHHLMCVSQVAQHFSGEGGDNLSQVLGPYSSIASWFANEWKEAHFCLKYLKDTKHTIAWPMIARFHHAVMLATDESNKKERIKELLRAIKAIAAFFALWRGSRDTTDGIDSRYRALFKFEGRPEGINFSRRGGNEPSAENLRQSFLFFLREDGGTSERKILTHEEFAGYSVLTPIYRTSKETAKFLLLVAAHNAAPSRNEPGLLEQGVPGVENMIDPENWEAVECETIEHLIPSSEFENMSSENSLRNRDILDRLGNLTLLPRRDNSILKDLLWEKRKKIYAIQSAVTSNDRDNRINEADFLSEESRSYFKNQPRYLPLTKAAASCENFNIGMIEKRGKNLAKFAWRILAEDWLGFGMDR